MSRERHDVLVIGGGPAGSTAALCAARTGASVLLVERDPVPRFHIGESLLPSNQPLFESLGLSDYLKDVPRVDKFGASFAFGDDQEPTDFTFDQGLFPAVSNAFNVERAGFDAALLQAARDAGVEVRSATAVRDFVELGDGECAVELKPRAGEPTLQRARYVIDASGQATIVARHLKIRRPLPDLQRVSYFRHYRGAVRREGIPGGFPLVVMCDEGWFWMIPIDAERTSVGLVIDPAVVRKLNIPSRDVLDWAIRRCPLVSGRLARATADGETHIAADYSYGCEPCAGPGYFLAGDAATFVDPIFSTGVCLGMMTGQQAAAAVRDLLDGRAAHGVRRRYRRFVHHSTSVFFRMVRSYYGHNFRELFMSRTGPLEIHRAVLSTLAGHVFPRPSLAVRWRLEVFHFFVKLQRYFPLVPHRAGFSLLGS